MLCLKGQKIVHVLSTAHIPLINGEMDYTDRRHGADKIRIPCPPLLEDYIPNMRVDRGDQRVALYNAGRRGVKAWRRIFYYLIECCVLNACVIEGYNDLRHRLCGRKKRDHHPFKVAL